jgi:hypothetical protein
MSALVVIASSVRLFAMLPTASIGAVIRAYTCFDRFALTVEARLSAAAFEPPAFLPVRPKPIPFASSDLADA